MTHPPVVLPRTPEKEGLHSDGRTFGRAAGRSSEGRGVPACRVYGALVRVLPRHSGGAWRPAGLRQRACRALSLCCRGAPQGPDPRPGTRGHRGGRGRDPAPQRQASARE